MNCTGTVSTRAPTARYRSWLSGTHPSSTPASSIVEKNSPRNPSGSGLASGRRMTRVAAAVGAPGAAGGPRGASAGAAPAGAPPAGARPPAAPPACSASPARIAPRSGVAARRGEVHRCGEDLPEEEPRRSRRRRQGIGGQDHRRRRVGGALVSGERDLTGVDHARPVGAVGEPEALTPFEEL